MLLGTYYDGVEIHREEKILYARFLVPHRVISTCQTAGGLRDDLGYLYNHQSSEPSGHHHPAHTLAASDPIAYRDLVCSHYQLPSEKCATLGTAANMRHAVTKKVTFRDLVVIAVCTGGVEGNAGRVGDPASVYEHEGRYERLSREEPVLHGTINTMVFINHELIPGAMVRTVMTATEAKTAVLQELAVNSRYSNGLATGTGTDQIGVAARLDTGKPLRSAGKHSVLGELIGRQNHWNAMMAELMGKEKAALVTANFTAIERDPFVAAAVAALIHLWDKVTWGIIPVSCLPELRATYGAQIAAAVSGKYTLFPGYRDRLAGCSLGDGDEGLILLVEEAIALGFEDKWPDCREEEGE
jgi:adenosylcobinamide amidohydrolase